MKGKSSCSWTTEGGFGEEMELRYAGVSSGGRRVFLREKGNLLLEEWVSLRKGCFFWERRRICLKGNVPF